MTEHELKAQAQKIRTQLDAIEARKWRDEHAPYVGKYFKYRNSYGHGPSWWLYGKVVSMGNGSLTMFKFQTSSLHIVEIETSSKRWLMNANWVPITAKEFKREWAKLMRRLQKVTL